VAFVQGKDVIILKLIATLC